MKHNKLSQSYTDQLLKETQDLETEKQNLKAPSRSWSNIAGISTNEQQKHTKEESELRNRVNAIKETQKAIPPQQPIEEPTFMSREQLKSEAGPNNPA